MMFFCNDTATTEIYSLSLHDALPISAALAQQQAAQAEAEKSRQAAEEASREKAAALAQERAAEAETEKARQATARAEAEKGELRAQLLNQLNSILQTRDSARGLIVNMSDVLSPRAESRVCKI